MPITTDDWLRDLKDTFEQCKSIPELMNAAKLLYELRHFDGVEEYAVNIWKATMKGLWPYAQRHTVVAVDLPGVIYSSYHAAPEETDMPLRMLRNIYRETEPSSFIIATDCRTGVSKYDNFPQYKGDRDDKPRELVDLFNRTIDYLTDKGMQVEEHDGLEADDILMTIATRAQLMGQPCILCTEDRDLWQALGPKTSIRTFRKKEYRNEEWLKAHHSITPAQIPDWLCFLGKNNVPGVPGIAEKIASKWLQAFGSVPGIYANRNTLTAAKRALVESLYENRYWDIVSLHTLAPTAPVSWLPN
jgi:5'-3' exonuclease